MSGVNKEAPVAEETNPTPVAVEQSQEDAKGTTPSSTAAEGINQAISSATSPATEKASKIFGSFTPSTPTKAEGESKESTPKPFKFGGFGAATSSSAWTAPTTSGGFGSVSMFTPTKKEEAAEEEEAGGDEEPESPEVHFEPLVQLEQVAVTTNEEDEDIVFKM